MITFLVPLILSMLSWVDTRDNNEGAVNNDTSSDNPSKFGSKLRPVILSECFDLTRLLALSIGNRCIRSGLLMSCLYVEVSFPITSSHSSIIISGSPKFGVFMLLSSISSNSSVGSTPLDVNSS